MTFNVGDVATLTYELRVADVLTDATVALTITAPDGTSTTPSPTHPSTGSYAADVLITQPGTWTYRWAASGAATDVETGTFQAGPASSDATIVRILIADTDPLNQLFTDAQLDAFINLEGAIKLAAAQALDTIASSEALVSKKIRTLDLQTDGPAVATALREHAKTLREQYYFEGSGELETTTDLGTGQLPRLASYEVAVTDELML